jgi:RecJ-like exonuclease
MAINMKIRVTITWVTDRLETWEQTRIFENREHLRTYINYLTETKGYKMQHHGVPKSIVNSQTEDDFIEEEEVDEDCENCQGTGEVGPYGHEYPEYYDCRDCRGTGKQSGCPDPDMRHDMRIDFPY